MASKKKAKEESADWFDELDQELEQKKEETYRNKGERDSKLAELNKEFIKDFWRIWIKFENLNVHLSIKPEHSSFAKFQEFPEEWKFNEDFDFASVRNIKLMDKTQEENRAGDTLSLEYYTEDDTFKMGVFFEFFEGETYYKYSGWKRIFARYLLHEFEFPPEEDQIDEIHEVLKDIVSSWYESHLKRNREILLEHIKVNYEKVEEYPR